MIRRSLLAGAVAMLVVPALAGCEAGFNAPTLQFHEAANGAYYTSTANGNEIRVSNAFVLAAPSGSSLPAGSQASLFMSLYNGNSADDTLTGVVLPNGEATSVTIQGGSVAIPANSGVNLTGPTPELVLNGLSHPLSGGEDIVMYLEFQHAGALRLDVPVEPQSFYYSNLSQPPSPTPTPAAAPTPTASATASPKTTPKPKATPTSKAAK